MNARLNAAMEYGKKLPASNGKTGVVGFCWGGTRSFGYAIAQPDLNAAVVYYGERAGLVGRRRSPEAELAKIKAPVLGLYGGNDARINATMPPTEAGDEEARQELRDAHRSTAPGTASWATRRAPAART